MFSNLASISPGHYRFFYKRKSSLYLESLSVEIYFWTLRDYFVTIYQVLANFCSLNFCNVAGCLEWLQSLSLPEDTWELDLKLLERIKGKWEALKESKQTKYVKCKYLQPKILNEVFQILIAHWRLKLLPLSLAFFYCSLFFQFLWLLNLFNFLSCLPYSTSSFLSLLMISLCLLLCPSNFSLIFSLSLPGSFVIFPFSSLAYLLVWPLHFPLATSF